MNITVEQVLPSTVFIVFGILLAVIAIFKEVSIPYFRVKLVIWQQIAVGVFGMILIAAGVVIYLDGSSPQVADTSCGTYRLKITTPRAGDVVQSEVKVAGTYEVEPPPNSVILINKQPEDPAYWPSSTRINFDPKQKTWTGDFYIGGNPPQKAEIIVGIMKESARILYNYYIKVGAMTGNWYPVDDFLQVIAECDRVPVTRGR